jgi:Uma2 family endonuclease
VKILMSLAEFELLSDDGLRHELHAGELISRPPESDEHGFVSAEIARVLGNAARKNALGKVLVADTGFILAKDTVRCPDVAFVLSTRIEKGKKPAFFKGAPDLAVEVFSPSDSIPQVMRKVDQYLRAGSQIVWIVYPETKQIHVREADGTDRILEADDTLDAPELLPGFTVTVASLFD